MPSASKKYMSHDIPYSFRQNTDFLYLCGFQEPNSILVIECKSSTAEYKSTIFVQKRDHIKELWEGQRSGMKGSRYLTGLQNAHDINDFNEYLTKYLSDTKDYLLWYNHNDHVNLEIHNLYLKSMTKKLRSHIHNPAPIVQSLRVIKSEAELKLMQYSCNIASNAFIEVMRSSYPQVFKNYNYIANE